MATKPSRATRPGKQNEKKGEEKKKLLRKDDDDDDDDDDHKNPHDTRKHKAAFKPKGGLGFRVEFEMPFRLKDVLRELSNPEEPLGFDKEASTVTIVRPGSSREQVVSCPHMSGSPRGRDRPARCPVRRHLTRLAVPLPAGRLFAPCRMPATNTDASTLPFLVSPATACPATPLGWRASGRGIPGRHRFRLWARRAVSIHPASRVSRCRLADTARTASLSSLAPLLLRVTVPFLRRAVLSRLRTQDAVQKQAAGEHIVGAHVARPEGRDGTWIVAGGRNPILRGGKKLEVHVCFLPMFTPSRLARRVPSSGGS